MHNAKPPSRTLQLQKKPGRCIQEFEWFRENWELDARTIGRSIFGILIGINNYYESINLHGCLNDVVTVNTFLTNTLRVPTNNIHSLAPPHDSRPEKLPTKANVLALIQEVAGRAVASGPDAFFFLHYSGHGARMPTIYHTVENRALKSERSYDEALCTLGDPDSDSLGDPLRDVELSRILDGLNELRLAVFLSLDCCHSGGADRNSAYASSGGADDVSDPGSGLEQHSFIGVRCPPFYLESDDEFHIGTGLGRGSEDGRNVLVQESWLYRNRNHNLLAACQPSEFAWERPDHNGTCGTMTYYLNKTLNNLQGSNTPVTYDMLITHLVFNSGIRNNIDPQQPMLLANRKRLVFGTNSRSVPTGVLQDTVTSKKTELGFTLVTSTRVPLMGPDQFTFGLLNPGEEHAGEVTIHEVSNMKATARIPTDSDITAISNIGWFAVLVQRNRSPIVYFNAANLSSDSVDHKSTPDTLHVELSEDGTSFLVRNSSGAAMDNIPSLKLNDVDFAKRLSRLIQHLSLYQLQIQFLTIFNLDPTYGVTQIFPREGADSVEIYPRESIEPIEISIKTPPQLCMRDQIKVLITSKAINFRYYSQPDLDTWVNPDVITENELLLEVAPEGQDNTASRQARVRRKRTPQAQTLRTLDEFWVESRDIITTNEDL
ncbi:putative caspase [Triangularia setosa]|uniref:Caspase n=1 Tax=Triangularia setosa TaxID=2587417 RepID=A0AAN6W529_9PEZI|nr:putative caspase [Podospora setosa]